jgi:hypothetical protein
VLKVLAYMIEQREQDNDAQGHRASWPPDQSHSGAASSSAAALTT